MSIAAVPGSYDPVTIGHIDIVCRAAALFEHVYVVAMFNADKTYLFSPDERTALLQDAFGGMKNVTCEFFGGMFYDYAAMRGVRAIVKGVRDAKDVEYEKGIAEFNLAHLPEAETVLLYARRGLENVSSSEIKALCRAGRDIGGLVTPLCEKMLADRLHSSLRDV